MRHVSGTLLLPIVLHASWDFSKFAQEASGAGVPVLLRFFLDTIVLLLALLLLVPVLRSGTAQHT